MVTDLPSDGAASFINCVWDNFELTLVIKTLLDPNEEFFAQKTLFYAALVAWIVAPKDNILRKRTIAHVIARQLIRLETDQRAARPYTLALADVSRRIQQWSNPKIARFYDEVYFPIGGLKTIILSHEGEEFYNYYQKIAGSASTAVGIAIIYHYHADHFASRDVYFPASLNKAADILKELDMKPTRGEGGADPRNIKQQWQQCRASVSLAYSASSITSPKFTANFIDLLDAMQNGVTSWLRCGHLLPKLINRAYYAETEIFSKCYYNEGSGASLENLPNISLQPFRSRPFSEREKVIMHHKFARRPGVTNPP